MSRSRSRNEFCATELGGDLETALGQNLTMASLTQSANPEAAQSAAGQVPKNVTCSPCTQALLVKLKGTELNTFFDLSAGVAQECGADFAGALPPRCRRVVLTYV